MNGSHSLLQHQIRCQGQKWEGGGIKTFYQRRKKDTKEDVPQPQLKGKRGKKKERHHFQKGGGESSKWTYGHGGGGGKWGGRTKKLRVGGGFINFWRAKGSPGWAPFSLSVRRDPKATVRTGFLSENRWERRDQNARQGQYGKFLKKRV